MTEAQRCCQCHNEVEIEIIYCTYCGGAVCYDCRDEHERECEDNDGEDEDDD